MEQKPDLLLDIWGISAETIMNLEGQGQSRVQSRLLHTSSNQLLLLHKGSWET